MHIKWGGRWQDGSGAVTGEEMEQVNSYISTAGLTQKLCLNMVNKLDKKKSQPPYILGHNSTSITNIESCKIIDIQSNCAYYEYNLSVLIAFLINSHIRYGAGGEPKN